MVTVTVFLAAAEILHVWRNRRDYRGWLRMVKLAADAAGGRSLSGADVSSLRNSQRKSLAYIYSAMHKSRAAEKSQLPCLRRMN